MATEAAAESALGTYVYAIVRGETQHEYGKIGLEEADVRRIGDAELSALVSSIRRGRVRPERRHLSAHNAVLKSALCEQAILPLTFGMIASSDHSGGRGLLRRRRPGPRCRRAALVGAAADLRRGPVLRAAALPVVAQRATVALIQAAGLARSRCVASGHQAPSACACRNSSPTFVPVSRRTSRARCDWS